MRYFAELVIEGEPLPRRYDVPDCGCAGKTATRKAVKWADSKRKELSEQGFVVTSAKVRAGEGQVI